MRFKTMDSAYKNQVLGCILNLLGGKDVKNATDKNANTIFLLLQKIADTLIKYFDILNNINAKIIDINESVHNIQSQLANGIGVNINNCDNDVYINVILNDENHNTISSYTISDGGYMLAVHQP